jgi:hypothetical protein
MRFVKLFSVAALSGFLLAGCASVAHIEKDETVNFSNYHTYAWAETKSASDSATTKVSDLTERKIREAVSAELAKSGWKQVKNRPDVLLSYDVLVENAERRDNNPVYSYPYRRLYFNPYTRRWNSFYFPSQFLGYDEDTRHVKEGTITISMIDPKTDKTIWQGWTTDEVNSRNLTNKEIQASVRSIFRKFDVAKR